MKYFRPPYTRENIETQFRELVKIFHPDKGGDSQKFVELKQERDLLLKLAESFKVQGRKRKILLKKKVKPAKKIQKIVIQVDPEKALNFLKELSRLNFK